MCPVHTGDWTRGYPARVTVPTGPTSMPDHLVYDSDGEEVWIGTHFKTEGEAWDWLEREATATIEMTERAQNRNEEEAYNLYVEHRDAVERLAAVQQMRSESDT